jgi:hypothetical protein
LTGVCLRKTVRRTRESLKTAKVFRRVKRKKRGEELKEIKILGIGMRLLPGMKIEANKETISAVDKTSWYNI